jgi:hypothetical protein
MVCGAAFEDLTHDEMMDFDGGVTPTVILSYISYGLLSAAGGGAVSITITYIWK